MKVIRLPKATKRENGSAYKHKINNDYGVPVMRGSVDTSSVNQATALTKPQITKRKKEEAQNFTGAIKVHEKTLKLLEEPKCTTKKLYNTTPLTKTELEIFKNLQHQKDTLGKL